MKKVPRAVFLCLLFAMSLSSCDRINSLFGKSTASSYQIDVSEGKTEIDKTLIVSYNNLMIALVPFAEKVKSGEIPASSVKEQPNLGIRISLFISVVGDNVFYVDQVLLLKMLQNIENTLSSTGDQELQDMASEYGKLRELISGGLFD